MKKYEFVDGEDITFKYELSDVDVERIYQHFMNEDDEICYVFQGDSLYGIITMGDLYRYFEAEEGMLCINRKYRCLKAVDDEEAEKIFEKIPTIYEIPVVCDEQLVGVVRKGKNTQIQWKALRKRLEAEHNGARKWYRMELSKWSEKIKGSLFLYRIPDYEVVKDRLSKEEKELWSKKRTYPSGASGLLKMSEEEKRHFFGDNYSEEYVESFCRDYAKIMGTMRNGIYTINDISNSHFKFENGYRNVPNARKEAARKVWIFGPCTALGAYVNDSQTIEFYLQRLLLEYGYHNYEVINCGLFGPEYVLGRVVTEAISDDDIVIILYNVTPYNSQGVSYQGDLGEVYFEIERPIENTFNSLAHCNGRVNEKIAERLFQDITPRLTTDNTPVTERVAVQDYYVAWDVIKYFREYHEKYQLTRCEGKCGAIVMNCNPFTKGHRYLIEQATLQVDLLYIFVVEEDKSVFKFEDRIEMVRRGTADLDNVKVLPSGKYIISKETFSQYFEKDNVEQVDDMDYDVRIFGEVVAKELGISVRFVGEEPFDKVTRKYNETMKSILPEYGMEVIEIPRVTSGNGQAISASAVRRALNEQNEELVQSMLPESTIEYLNVK